MGKDLEFPFDKKLCKLYNTCSREEDDSQRHGCVQTLTMSGKSVRENTENMENNGKFYIIMLQDVNKKNVIIFEFIST